MKKYFEEPSCEVVRFNNDQSIITESNCYCNVAGYDYGIGEDECVGRNLPECTCGLITEANCV